MGKRHTAKTGDKAIYKNRNNVVISENNFVDDDDMYNEVDRYHNARDELQDDMLKFGEQNDDSGEEGMQQDVEGVFDLGLDQSDDESESNDGSSSEEEQEATLRRQPLQAIDDSDDSSTDSVDQLEESDLLNWGKRKKDYYHGDTADLEIGQEVEDAELEEEGAKEILKARMENMTEDDFMLDNEEEDTEDEDVDTDVKSSGDIEMISAKMNFAKRRKLSTLSKREKMKLMTRNHPELLPLVSHFRDEAIRPCAEKTSVVVNCLQNNENAEAVGATSTGLHYLLTKAMIETATALNVCQYLLIKRDQAATSNDTDNIIGGQDEDNIKNHPVIGRLNQLNHLSEKLGSKIESKVGGLSDQLGNLVKASALMSSIGEDSAENTSTPNDTDIIDDGGSIIEDDSDGENDSISAASSSDDEDQIVRQKTLMNEARFALRKQDDADIEVSGSKRKRRRALPAFSDFGDDENANENDIAAASKSLATTINRISQRSKSSKKPIAAPEVNDEDDADRFQRGLAMMNADIGGDGDDAEIPGDDDLDEDMDEDENDFYAQIKKKSNAKKEYKKQLYAVAPKYPGIDQEVVGERALSKQIMKNRGLVAHKNKLSRNPRVKKREQYRKALIKRKGAVREVRTEEGHKYGGEETGIKSGISRSRKLGV